MVKKPFFFYVSDLDGPVAVNSELWGVPLPSDRKNSENLNDSAITIGDYFTAVETFLSRDDFFVVKSSLQKSQKIEVQTSGIEKVEIFLVKHGHFYHPAKIAIGVLEKTILFVLNLAASEEGLFCLEREVPVLKKLSAVNLNIPTVYEKGDVFVRAKSVLSMFLAKWFDGYNEFHTSYDDGVKKVIVWDYEEGFYYLSEKEIFQVYKKATKIMASCYNVETSEQIQPWHHAAGDFVVKNGVGGIDVHLITTRQYTSLFENTFDDADSILEGMLIFLISLSIRMRLDRVDGVDESVWGDDVVLRAVIAGFFEDLVVHKKPSVFESDVSTCFKNYISGIELETLNDFSMMVRGSYHPDSSDYLIVSDNIVAHTLLLEQELIKAVEL